MFRLIVNTIFFVFISVHVLSQSIGEIKHYTINDGLSQSSITCIFQSSDGIMWFGTQDGLNQFDGYEFISIKKSPTDSNSLSNNFINDICEGEDGDLIIATKNGITIWRRNKNIYQRINVENKKIATIDNNNVLQVEYIDNTIWALTEKELVRIKDDKLIKFQYFPDTSSIFNLTGDIDINKTSDLLVDKNKNIWFTTNSGLEIFYPKSERFFRIYDNSSNKLSNNLVFRLLEQNNNVWIGTYNGLNKFVKNSGTIENTFFYENNEKILKENIVSSIFIDNNTFWIGTDNGIKTFNGEEICDFENPKLNNIKSRIYCISKDNSNNIWVGTKYSGLYRISLDEPKFQSFINFPIENKYVFSIYSDEFNQLWVGTRGLFVLDNNTKKNIFSTDFSSYEKDQEVTVYSLLNMNKDMFVGTNVGIFVVNKVTFEITKFNKYFNIKENKIFKNNVINQIIADGNGVYWIGSTKGLIKFDGKNISLYQRNDKQINSLNSNNCVQLLNDKNKIWIATYNGLNLFEKDVEKFSHWTTNDGLPDNLVTDIFKENDSIMWLSTARGLSKFNILKGIFVNYTNETRNIVNDFFYQILPDNANNLWLSSNYGIVKFNKTSEQFYTYKQNDGLPFLEFNSGASFKSLNNIIYFGGSGGIVWCDVNKQEFHMFPPKVVITKIEFRSTFNENKSILFPDSSTIYSFKYDEVANIYFTVPDYHNSQNNKYRYKVVGLNNKWSTIQNDNSITLIGLAPGKYSILIKGANTFNIWNNNYSKINIEVIPPFSKSIYSKILYTLLILFLIGLVFFIVFRNIKIENKILQDKNVALKKVDEQKKLLEDKNKSITDSINYAKRIIEAILPSEEHLNKFIPESFIFFLPKDIVSGDFYWFAEKNNNVFVAAVDCTGHGIPGAFMSIIGMNLLTQLVNNGINDPSVILNMMNKEVILTLKKSIDSVHLKDGMDMSLAVIDKKRNIIKFSSAYNPAYIIRDNNIIQLKGERKSVGNDFDFDSFSTFSMRIRKNDVVYLFSDGYTDQFGGDEHKKFKFRRFRFILLSIHQLSPEKQKKKLIETLNKWKGKNEQVDDILIIGFKPFSIPAD